MQQRCTRFSSAFSSSSTETFSETRFKESKVISMQLEQVFNEAVQLFNAQNYQAALGKFREVIKQDSQHSGSYYYGFDSPETGPEEDGQINFRNALGYPGLDYTAHYYLGRSVPMRKTILSSFLSFKYIAVTNHEPGKRLWT